MSEETKKVKSETEISDDSDKFVDAKTENSSYYLKKTFNEHHDKKLREQNTECNTNLDCEDRVITDILTEIAIRIRECIQSDKKASKTTKFLKIINSFFHSIFDSK